MIKLFLNIKPREADKAEKGFSLIELLVVIAITGIISAMAGYSYLRGLSERKVISASRNLYAGFKEALSLAVNRGENISISCSVASDSYLISDSDNNTIRQYVFPDYIDLYSASGSGKFTYNSRGMMGAGSGKVKIRYRPGSGPLARGIRVTSAGGLSLIDEKDSNW